MQKEELYCQVARERLLSQDAQNSEFSSKAGTQVAFSSGLIGLAALTLVVPHQAMPASAMAASVAMIVFFVSTVLTSLYVIWPRKWMPGPKFARLLEHLEEQPDREFERWTGEAYALAVDRNSAILMQKAWALTASTACLGVQACALVALILSRIW